MSRARTPFGAVPISTIYGYDYPLLNNTAIESLTKHENLSDCVDYMVRSSRAFSENRIYDPYYTSPAASSLSFLPSALRLNRERSISPIRATTPFREPTPFRASSPIREPYETRSWLTTTPRSSTLTFSSSTPWNATGYYHYPRYPESYRGTASTYSPLGRRFPVRRFVPGYTSTKSSRRY